MIDEAQDAGLIVLAQTVGVEVFGFSRRRVRSSGGVVKVMRRIGVCTNVCARYSKKPPLRAESSARKNKNATLELRIAKRYKLSVGMKKVLSLV